MLAVQVVFLGALALLVYAYVVYPVVGIVGAILARKPCRRGSETPTVSVIIAAYNEEAVIEAKLANTLELDYPRRQLEIIVASDGSDDGTDARVEALRAQHEHGAVAAGTQSPPVEHEARIDFLRLPRQGKNAALNAAVARARGEVLVFTDADALLVRDALRHLVAPFADAKVGGVAGEYRSNTRASPALRAARAFHYLQSNAGSISCAQGRIYALRRILFVPVPSQVSDDFYLSLQVLSQHRRLVFEHRAAAYPASKTKRYHDRFSRKVRVAMRSMMATWHCRHLFNPVRYGFCSVQLLSHKVLRRFAFLPVLALAITGPVLWRFGGLYEVACLAQAAFHAAALAGFLLPKRLRRKLRFLAAPYRFDQDLWASAVAFVKLVRGQRREVWQRA